MVALKVQSLKFKYSQNNNYAVDDVSFEIEKGSYTAIVGLNGCGKSTLARLLCGLEQPEAGSVTIEQNFLTGIVFQSPKDQIVSSLVYRDTEFGPKNLKLDKSEVELRTIESLNVTDMLYRADSSTNALSLGQTQKIALSGIIALQPDILIMDEAISMLDPVSRADILEFLRYWHKKGGTIIHITHDPDAINEADKIICMKMGKIAFDGKKTDFLNEPQNLTLINGLPLPKTDKKKWNKSAKELVLCAKALQFKYDHRICIQNVSFNLYKGSVTALTGPSGAGKSTILEICSGLLKPAAGQIFTFQGKKPVLAQQNSQAALFENFAPDDVAFGPSNSGVKGEMLVQTVKDSMNLADIPFETYAERKTFCLSGGEQRRLSIAGILAMNADVLFFDEPTAGLDSDARYKVLNMFRKLAQEGKTVLFSTHKKDEADFADREIKIDQGKVISDSFDSLNQTSILEGSSEQTLQNPFIQNDGIKILDSLRKTSVSADSSTNRGFSLIHHLPSWFRIILFLALFVLSLSGTSALFCAALMLVSAVYAMSCGTSVKKLIKSCIKILPFLLIFAVFQIIFHPAIEGETAFTTWKWFMITPSKLWLCLCTMLKTFSAIGCIFGFYVSTPEYDLIDGLKILLKPLEIIKIPVSYFILILEVIFRFIPLLTDEALCIIKTQLIRGGLGKKKGKIARIKGILPLIVPMLVRTIKRSEKLADAITVRCFK